MAVLRIAGVDPVNLALDQLGNLNKLNDNVHRIVMQNKDRSNGMYALSEMYSNMLAENNRQGAEDTLNAMVALRFAGMVSAEQRAGRATMNTVTYESVRNGAIAAAREAYQRDTDEQTHIPAARGTPLRIAQAEIDRHWGYAAGSRTRADQILRELPAGTLGETSANLWRAAEEARAAGNNNDYRAYRYALAVVRRAEFIELSREQGQESIEALNNGNLTGFFDRMYSKGQALAAGGAGEAIDRRQINRPSNAAPAAAPAAAASPDAAATPGGTPGATAAPANGAGGRARLYRFRDQSAPPENEIPVLGENQVRSLQQKMVDAGITFERGADGKYGPNTHNALKAFAASMEPPLDLTQADFTANNGQGNEHAQRLLQALEARAQSRGGAETGAPAAGQSQLTEAGQRLLAAVQQHSSTSDAAVAVRTLVPQDNQGIFNGLVAARSMTGDGPLRSALASAMGLTEQEVAGLQFTGDSAENLQVRGDIIRNIEQALNTLPGAQPMTVDGVLDARLGAILGENGALAAIRAALDNSQPLTVAAAGAPGATPGGTTTPGGRGTGN